MRGDLHLIYTCLTPESGGRFKALRMKELKRSAPPPPPALTHTHVHAYMHACMHGHAHMSA